MNKQEQLLKEKFMEWLNEHEGCIITEQFLDDVFSDVMALKI